MLKIKGPRFLLIIVSIFLILILISFGLFHTQILSWFKGNEFNLIIITLDAARRDHFLLDDRSYSLTPNIYRLTKNGVIFKRAYCISGSTPPSMAGMFISKYPYWPPESSTGSPRWNQKTVFGFMRFFNNEELLPGIPDYIPTLPGIMKQNGYTTIGISTNPYLTKDFGFDHDFDFFDELSTQSPFSSAEQVVQRIKLYLTEMKLKKIFLWAHFMDLHSPLKQYAKFREKAKSKKISTNPLPVSQWTEYAKKIMTSFFRGNFANENPTEENLLKAREEYSLRYRAILLRVDQQIGSLIDLLRQNNLLDKTIVIILNDHGDEFLEHGDWTHTGQLYEEIVRGIWLMHNSKLFSSPIVVEDLVSHIDVLPTVIDLLKFKSISQWFDGVSRTPLIKRKSNQKNGVAIGLLDQRAYIIYNDYKLIINNDFMKKDRGAARSPAHSPIELYHLKADPNEKFNLAQSEKDIVDRLFVKLKAELYNKGIHYWSSSKRKTEISKETLERLKALGYIHR